MKLQTIEVNKFEGKIKPFAFNLAGGGKAGGYECGVLAAFAQMNVLQNAKFIAGTSTGGLNTGTASVFGGISSENPQPWWKMVDIWEEIEKNENIYNGSIGSEGIKGFFENIGVGMGFLFNKLSILNPTPLYNKLDKVFGNLTLKEASQKWGIDIIITAMDLNSTEEKFFTSFDLETQNYSISLVLKATSAIPGIFPSVPIIMADGKTHWFVDGGLAANNPFVSSLKYNMTFPNKKVEKIIVVFCYPDEYKEEGFKITGVENNKEYKSYKDVLLRSVSTVMNGQEQIAELIIEEKVKNSNWDVLAIWPKEQPGNPLDFSNLKKLIQIGYDDVAKVGKGWSYKDNAMINIEDFLKR
jgi:predicted acylesterase/phospholipase RssA